MANAKRDQNQTPTMIGVSNADGITVTNIQANATLHSLEVDDNTTGTVTSRTNAPHDENHIPTLMAASSSDGVTPVTLAVDPATGKLLMQST